MSADRLIRLADRLKAASSPDREFDLEILCATSGCDWRWAPNFPGNKVAEANDYGWGAPENRVLKVDHFTSSIDSALTLVDQNFRVDVQRGKSGDGYACIWGAHGNRSSRAATPALALCVANLLILSSMTRQD